MKNKMNSSKVDYNIFSPFLLIDEYWDNIM